MKTVFVVGRDWKFRALLRAELREEGYDARGFETLEEAATQLDARPAALVFDTAESAAADAKELAQLATRLRVLVIAAADEPLPATEARVLRRPVPLAAIVAVVRELSGAAP